MSTRTTNGFKQRVALGLAAVTLALVTAAQAAQVPPIQGRDFELHLDSGHASKAVIHIGPVSGVGPWTFDGTMQFNGGLQKPINGQMTKQTQGGYKIVFKYKSSPGYWENYEGAIRADNNLQYSPLFMAGQYFTYYQKVGYQLPFVGGPHPFCATSGDATPVAR